MEANTLQDETQVEQVLNHLDKPIAIQGYEGSFHQVAVRKFFGNKVPILTCNTFREVIKKAQDKKETTAAAMAIENSIAGSILPNYNLLQKSKLKIIGEVYLQINQHLMVNKGVGLEDIREVHSHPMALLQCMDYLEKNNTWKLVESEDTALSAKQLQKHHSRHAAAIASELAAELYDLEIIAPNIHSLKNNYTRFLILQREEIAPVIPGANKASVYFHTDHSQGSLAKTLTTIADAGVNLSKLQSFPIPGSNFKYSFHADMEFTSPEQFNEVIKRVDKVTTELKVYGVYKSGML